MEEWIHRLEAFRSFVEERWREQVNRRSALTILAVMTVISLSYAFIFRAPSSFPEGAIITIDNGESLTEVSYMLAEKNIVSSAFAFKIAAFVIGGDKQMKAGDYLFKNSQGLIAIAKRITSGTFGLEPIAVRIPEGSMVRDIARITAERLPHITQDKFQALAIQYEGYLYPDTYFFLPSATEDTVITTMRSRFDEQFATIEPLVASSTHSKSEVVIMASILEREANTYENKRIIAGILWKRIKKGMPLQVDAPFIYAIGKGSATLTRADLAKDSPYNTYVNKGLPPTPIASPSIYSLKAAVDSVETPYFFYLDGNDGVTRYSANYEQHLRYKHLYIDN